MASIKYTEAAQQQRAERLKSLREDRKALLEFAALKDYPEWAKLKAFINKRVEFAKVEERNAAAYHDGEDISSEVFGLRAARARAKQMALDFVVECVEKKEEQVRVVEEQIAELEKVFKQAKEVLA